MDDLNQMDKGAYLKERVVDQLAWFEKKSAWNQKCYRGLKTVVLILSIGIPFMAGFVQEDRAYLQYAIGAAGLIIAIAEGLMSIYKYHDNWVQYRSTAEALKKEALLFKTGAGPYQDMDADAQYKDFVVRVEGLLGEENQEWKRYVRQEKK